MPELSPISYCKLLLGSDTLEDCDKEQFVTNDEPVSDPPATNRQLLIHPKLKIRKRQKCPKNRLLNSVKTELVLCGQHLIGLGI